MKRVMQIFSILVISFIILFLALNIDLKQTGKVVSETQTITTKNTSYVYANGLAASYDSEGKEKYYLNDHLGGTSKVIDKNGNVVASEEYLAFGEEKSVSGDEKFTYTGKELDDTGLYYYGARYYDADTGRFTQPDPLTGGIENPQSLNRYVYTLNNPTNNYDPDGKKTRDGKYLVYMTIAHADKIGGGAMKFSRNFDEAKGLATSYFGEDNFILVSDFDIKSIPEMVDKAKKASNLYGKFDMVIINAHGNPGEQIFDADEEYGDVINSLSYSSPEKKRLQELGGAIEEKGICILSTCYAAKSDYDGHSILQIYSEETGRTSFGPDFPLLDMLFDKNKGLSGTDFDSWNHRYRSFAYSDTAPHYTYLLPLVPVDSTLDLKPLTKTIPEKKEPSKKDVFRPNYK